MRELTIGDKRIADDAPAFVICEASHNHLGSRALAKEQVRLAAGAGASAVKFQKRGKSTYEGLKDAGEHEYARTRLARELNRSAYQDLCWLAHERGLAFIATAFDAESADFLARVGVDAYKVASGDITNLPLLEYLAELGKPLLVSTGGCYLDDMREAHQLLTELGAQFALLHCTSEYPCQVEHVNLRLIETYRAMFPETVVGFSSHIGREYGAVLEAVAYTLGARIIEKHVTLTPEIDTGEHRWSLTPAKLDELGGMLRVTARALGDGVKRILPEERQGILRLGKHLAYAKDLQATHIVQPSDLAIVGAGIGVPPSRVKVLAGGMLTRNVGEGEDMREGDVIAERECYT